MTLTVAMERGAGRAALSRARYEGYGGSDERRTANRQANAGAEHVHQPFDAFRAHDKGRAADYASRKRNRSVASNERNPTPECDKHRLLTCPVTLTHRVVREQTVEPKAVSAGLLKHRQSGAAVPAFVRALCRFDQWVGAAIRGYEIARDELLFATVPPEMRQDVTVSAYSGALQYLPGNTTFSGGLFDWERSVIAELKLPPGSSILLGGAGGGREMVALAELGHEVVAFEPNETLYAGLQRLCAERASCRAYHASYGDLVEGAQGKGPLSAESGPFAAIVFGWGSFSHLTDASEQIAVLQAARSIGERAAVVLSFFLRADGHTTNGRSARLQALLRRVLQGEAATRRGASGLAYRRDCGFLYRYTRSEIAELARGAGYELVSLKSVPYAHAVLRPLAEQSNRTKTPE